MNLNDLKKNSSCLLDASSFGTFHSSSSSGSSAACISLSCHHIKLEGDLRSLRKASKAPCWDHMKLDARGAPASVHSLAAGTLTWVSEFHGLIWLMNIWAWDVASKCSHLVWTLWVTSSNRGTRQWKALLELRLPAKDGYDLRCRGCW